MSRVRSYTYNIHIHSTHAGSYMYLNGMDITTLLVMIYLFLLFGFVMPNWVLSFFFTLNALWSVMSRPSHKLMRHHALKQGRACPVTSGFCVFLMFSVIWQVFTIKGIVGKRVWWFWTKIWKWLSSKLSGQRRAVGEIMTTTYLVPANILI